MGAQESSRRVTVDNNSGDDTIGVVKVLIIFQFLLEWFYTSSSLY
jgi:hypothetical protein